MVLQLQFGSSGSVTSTFGAGLKACKLLESHLCASNGWKEIGTSSESSWKGEHTDVVRINISTHKYTMYTILTIGMLKTLQSKQPLELRKKTMDFAAGRNLENPKFFTKSNGG